MAQLRKCRLVTLDPALRRQVTDIVELATLDDLV